MDSPAQKFDALVQELETQLVESAVLTPESPGYAESIKRWTDSAEKKAVCIRSCPTLDPLEDADSILP